MENSVNAGKPADSPLKVNTAVELVHSSTQGSWAGREYWMEVGMF